jgi:hypothetical protein
VSMSSAPDREAATDPVAAVIDTPVRYRATHRRRGRKARLVLYDDDLVIASRDVCGDNAILRVGRLDLVVVRDGRSGLRLSTICGAQAYLVFPRRVLVVETC